MLSAAQLYIVCFTLDCNIEDVVEIPKSNPVKKLPKVYSTIELFAGAGGLVLGIEKAVGIWKEEELEY